MSNGTSTTRAPRFDRWLPLLLMPGVLLFTGTALFLGPRLQPQAQTPPLLWGLAGGAILALVVGSTLAARSDASGDPAGRGRVARILGLALCEAAGLTGGAMTLLWGGWGWSAGLGAASLLALAVSTLRA